MPAGGISGRLIDDKGLPLNSMNMDIHPVFPDRIYPSFKALTKEKVAELKEQSEKEHALRNILSSPRNKSSNGTFAFTSLPLDYTYRVSARSKHTLLLSEPITLTRENSIEDITLQHAPLEKISGQILLPDGTPCVGMPVRLKVRIMNHRYGNQPVKTDKNGCFEFTRLNPNPAVTYNLIIDTGEGWQPITQSVKPGCDKAFTLKKGLSLKGRVIDHQTGRPLHGVSVATASMADRTNRFDVSEIYQQTDEDGQFSFTTLSPGEHAIGVNNMEVVSPAGSNSFFTIINAGETDFIELEVKPITNLPHFML